jgi:hypothetical protein
MGPKDHGVEQRAPVEFLRRMLATIQVGTVELPAFPQVVIQVQEVLKNPNYSVQMLVRPISADPILANRLLNMANSTAFNATGRVIIDLGVALTRLGAEKVYSVVRRMRFRLFDDLNHCDRSRGRWKSYGPSVASPISWRAGQAVEACHARCVSRSAPSRHLYILVQLARQEASRLLSL